METIGEDAIFLMERTGGVRTYITASTSIGYFGIANNYPLRLMTNGGWRAQFNSDNSLTMRNNATCSATGEWLDASSIEYKENIRNLTEEEALETLTGLKPVKFNYKSNKTEGEVGFIAEEVPELVATKTRKNLGTMDIVAVLTKVLQEQQKLNQEQQKTIDELKKKIEELEKK